MVALRREKDLRLVREPTKRLAVNDPIPVALELRAVRVEWQSGHTPLGGVGEGRGRREAAALVGLKRHPRHDLERIAHIVLPDPTSAASSRQAADLSATRRTRLPPTTSARATNAVTTQPHLIPFGVR